MRDPWNERHEEDEYLQRMRNERVERMTEQASLEPWQARIQPDPLQPDLAALHPLPAQEKPGAFESWLDVVGFAIGLVIALIVAFAVAFTIFMGVAWALS